jgi:hypothetical protein
MLDNQECLSDGYIVHQLRLLFAVLNRTLLIRCNICVAQRSCEVVLRLLNLSNTAHDQPRHQTFACNENLLARLAILGQLGYTVSKECSLACSSQLESSRLRYRTSEITNMRLIFGSRAAK